MTEPKNDALTAAGAGQASSPPPAPADAPSPELIARSLSEDILRMRGIAPDGRLARFLEPLMERSLERFIRLAVEFDRVCANSDFVQAARWLLPHFASGVEVIGADNVPTQGPVLLVSNHPGNFDEVVIAASLNRPDLRIFANAYPILTSFPHISRHAVFSRENDPFARMNALRHGIKHLRTGNLLVIFPTGRTDPDPRHVDGARESLGAWSQSVELMVNKAPETQVVVTMVSGVNSSVILRSPPLLFRQRGLERQKLAGSVQMALQMLFPRLFHLVPRITFGAPLSLQEMVTSGGQSVQQAVIRQAESLLEMHTVHSPLVQPLALRP